MRALKYNWQLQSTSLEPYADLSLSPPSTQNLSTVWDPAVTPQNWNPRLNVLPVTRQRGAGSWRSAMASHWIRIQTWTFPLATVVPERSQKVQRDETGPSHWATKGETIPWILTAVTQSAAQGQDAQPPRTANPSKAMRWVGAGWTRSQRGRGWWTLRISAELLLFLSHHLLPHTWMWHHCPQLPGGLPRTIQPQGCHPVHPNWARILPSPPPNMGCLLETYSLSSRPTTSSADRGE